MDLRLMCRNALFVIPIYIIIIGIVYFIKKPRKVFPNVVTSFLLCLAMLGVATITGLTPLSGFHTDLRFNEIQWNAYESIMEMLGMRDMYGYINVFGNLLLFTPFGFLVPLQSRGNRLLWKVALYGFGYSLLIEIWQLFLARGTDTGDLLLNTLGAVLGYAVFYLFNKICKNFSAKFSSTDAANVVFQRVELVVALFLPAVVTIVAGFFDRARYFNS